MGVIEIDTSQVPYAFNIELSSKIYTIAINYNYIFDYFTVDLKLGDKVLVLGEKLVINKILFREVYEDKEHNINEEFPEELLMPVSSNNIDRITYDNLGKEVELYYFDRSELNE